MKAHSKRLAPEKDDDIVYSVRKLAAVHKRTGIVVAHCVEYKVKHYVGFVYNEVSRRYVSDSPKMYEFDELREAPADNIKQGSGAKHPESDIWIKLFNESNTQCKHLYELAVKRGICPEQARSVLPQSMMTKYMVTGSLSAWARAYKLRIDKHSQKEIQLLAEQWNEIITPLFPVAWTELTK